MITREKLTYAVSAFRNDTAFVFRFVLMAHTINNYIDLDLVSRIDHLY